MKNNNRWQIIGGYALPITLYLYDVRVKNCKGVAWDFSVDEKEYEGIYDQIFAIVKGWVDR